MGQPKKVENAATTSEQPLPGKKNSKSVKAAAKIKKKSSKVKSSKKNTKDIETVNAITIKVEEGTEKSKTVKDAELKLDGSTRVNDQTQPNTTQIQPVTKTTFGGFIFMCNGKTKPECFHYKVLGLPEHRKDLVFRIKPGMKLFLYDIEQKLLHGIFKASSFGGMMLVPNAFAGAYPAQVRYEVERSCTPLPFHSFKYAIKDSFTGIRNMFNQELTINQVEALCKLFKPLPQQQQIVKRDALVPQPVQLHAPGPAAVPAPVVLLQPTMLPMGGPIPSHPSASFSVNHTEHMAPLPPVEFVPAPFGARPYDHLVSDGQEFRNFGLNHEPFLVPPVIAHANDPLAYTHPFRAAPGAYETNLNYHIDPTHVRLDRASAHSLGLSHSRLPHDVPGMSNFVLGHPGDVGPGILPPIHVPSALSGYGSRNELQSGSSSYHASMPVSSRYSFAGPTMMYKRGHA